MDFYSVNVEAVDSKIRVGDAVKALDGKWYNVHHINPEARLAVARDAHGDERVIVFRMVDDLV